MALNDESPFVCKATHRELVLVRNREAHVIEQVVQIEIVSHCRSGFCVILIGDFCDSLSQKTPSGMPCFIGFKLTFFSPWYDLVRFVVSCCGARGAARHHSGHRGYPARRCGCTSGSSPRWCDAAPLAPRPRWRPDRSGSW